MEKVFFPLNEELKTELDQIKLAIQGEQNGLVSQSMGQRSYKKNYGVPYISLRKLAAQYLPSKRLAGCLWNIGYRETMLLALLLFPKDTTTVDEVLALLPDLKEMELAEFGCRGLFSQMPCAARLVSAFLESGAPLGLELAYLTAGQLLDKCDEADGELTSLFGRVGQDLELGRPSVAKAVSVFLVSLCLFPAWEAKVRPLVRSFSASSNELARWVAEEVKTQLDY